MPSEFYCSSCGIQLTCKPTAIPGKGKIVNLVDPHECPGYAIKAKKDKQETVLDIINRMKDVSGTSIVRNEDEKKDKPRSVLRDKRSDLSKSSAPPSLVRNLTELDPSRNEDLE